MTATGVPATSWPDALDAARLFAVDPVGLGGVRLRALPGPARDAWLGTFRALLPSGTPLRPVPLAIADERLLGGLDLTATLAAGRPVANRGLIAEADGGVLLLAMAERLAPGTAARLAATLDSGEVTLERDGFGERHPARIGIVALDEGIEPDERPPSALLDRLAFAVDLTACPPRSAVVPLHPPDIVAARARLPAIVEQDGAVEALCAAAAALGIVSIRAPLLALRAARAAAALDGRGAVSEADLALAARLVLAPRATALPAGEEEQEAPPGEPPPSTEAPDSEGGEDESPKPLDEVVLEAARAAIPAGLLASLLAQGSRGRAQGLGKAGAERFGALRGRPAGTRRGEPRGGARLSLLDTLRAAAPWQRLRRGADRNGPLAIRRDDLRVKRFVERTRTTTIFVVDASGSAALHRLAEAKGAVELLLADCYIRRDQVALIAFRGRGADIVLPPTRSLARAKRSLAALPGGGGTPLVAGLDAAAQLADAVRRRGESAVVVVLTDGRGNVARDGHARRAQAQEEALSAAKTLRLAGGKGLLVDTSPQPRPEGAALAAAMGAVYLPLPQADAVALSAAVRAGSGRS